MKVCLVNGSPNQHGCTDRALKEIAAVLQSEEIETEFFWIGKKPVSGCLACGGCRTHAGCVLGDIVTDFQELAGSCDGFVFGSPVHYAAASGSMTAFLDRVFYSANSKSPALLAFKPTAAIVSARRGGTTAALDQLNKYFGLMQMPVITSTYWNMVHGSTPEQVEADEEGLQTMRNLGRNMAWFLKIKEAGLAAGIPFPETERIRRTNFVR